MKAHHHLESEKLLPSQQMKYPVRSTRVRNAGNQVVAVPTADVSAKILARTVECAHVLAKIVNTRQKIAGKAGISIIRS